MWQGHGALKSRNDHGHNRGLRIEFIGGPYDGHEQSWFASPHQLPAEVMWFVCKDAFRLLNGEEARRPTTGMFTSVALYKLEVANDVYRYRFVRALPVNDLIAPFNGL